MPKDDAEAVKWWRKSADQGNAEAQRNLSGMYLSGRGVNQDVAEATKWWRKAAGQDHEEARGDMLERNLSPAERMEAQRRAREVSQPSQPK